MEKTPMYSKEFIELLKRNTTLSPSTAHKIFHPFCVQCLTNREGIVRNGNGTISFKF